MDTKYLNYVLTIAKKQNMTKAAEELFVSQSSLSQYLTKLEAEIDAPLFIRAKGKLELTEAGKLYIDAAQKVIDIKNDLYYQIRSLNHKSHITIGITSIFGLEMLTTLIPQYKKDFPDVTIEITETNIPSITTLILEESIDCAVIAINDMSVFDPGQLTHLGREEVLLAVPASHPFALTHKSGSSISWESFANTFNADNFILSKKASSLRVLSNRIFTEIGFEPSTMCETNSILTIRSMVEMGIGIAFIAKTCANENNNICYFSLDPPIYRDVAFVHRKGWVLNTPEKALIEHILQYFAQEKIRAQIKAPDIQ